MQRSTRQRRLVSNIPGFLQLFLERVLYLNFPNSLSLASIASRVMGIYTLAGAVLHLVIPSAIEIGLPLAFGDISKLPFDET